MTIDNKVIHVADLKISSGLNPQAVPRKPLGSPDDPDRLFNTFPNHRNVKCYSVM